MKFGASIAAIVDDATIVVTVVVCVVADVVVAFVIVGGGGGDVAIDVGVVVAALCSPSLYFFVVFLVPLVSLFNLLTYSPFPEIRWVFFCRSIEGTQFSRCRGPTTLISSRATRNGEEF